MRVNWNELTFDLPSNDREFVIGTDSFEDLEIRSNDERFYYFYDKRRRRLVTDFVLREKPQVCVMCTVTLIKVNEVFSPRLKFWKKDKRRSGEPAIDFELPDMPEFRAIKASVDTAEGREGFWKLIAFLQELRNVETGDGSTFSLVSTTEAQILSAVEGKEKSEILAAIGQAIGGSLTSQDIALLVNRRGQLDEFSRMLTDRDYFLGEMERLGSGPEKTWQEFFERNSWIFGYGLNLISTEEVDGGKLERITTGANLFTGAGKRSDAVMRSRGYISSLLFCEIKTPAKPLLASTPYRKPDVYRPSDELVGGVAQVQKTARKAVRQVTQQLHRFTEPSGDPMDVEVSMSRPRQVLLIGTLAQFETDNGINGEMLENFELYRTAVSDTEIITFDELYQRARFIVLSQPGELD
ncbi:Shedu immune nuclease family protein [Pseudonocardia sp. ICBG1034]|uniref:Shedu immune nuclease family protein n=1 Tax=Pseudonocardia sp. ICBG1034 TaxID=2844381 RepID=UPI001CCB0D34|nr:Shedu immune nuclease family protein [Pseudonocardia sp. ICBG1034]